MFSAADIDAILLTLRLATIVTIILLIVGTPLAWWLGRTHSPFKGVVNALVTLPLVLPPTVIGFYFLVFLSPNNWFGELLQSVGLDVLPFTFSGLVFASVLYSMPFVVQPLQNAMGSLDARYLEVAATLNANPIDRFFTIILPMCRSGFVTATVLGFAHTVGEFGVVLMIGGSIPGETKVASVQIYELVESLQYDHAHWLAGSLLLFSFVVLLLLSVFNRRSHDKKVSVF